MISLTKVLLPEPDTPVTQVNKPKGMRTSKFFRLFSRAPNTSSHLPFVRRRFSGTAICLAPHRYCPVIDSLLALISSIVPSATTLPPCTPAPGPISIMWSAAIIVSSSCSTTIRVFPRSRKRLRVDSSRALSRW